jgi:hypothetical protein
MGRGRSKAKQTKVARDLKYSNHDMDLESLAKELHGESGDSKPESRKYNFFYDDSSEQSN